LGLITVIAFVLILSLLIFVHELGHFIVAKRAGIVVEEFAIGFPPRAVKVWQEEGSITLDGHPFVIGRKVNVPRALQVGANVYAETGIDAQGRACVTKLELVEPEEESKEAPKKQTGSEARFFGLVEGKAKVAPINNRPATTVEDFTRPTEYVINWIPFGGYVRMLGEEDPGAAGSFASKSKKARFAVLVAGSAMNLVMAVVFFTLTAMSGVPEPVTGLNLAGEEMPLAKTIVTEVVADTPASQAGLQAGDILLGADDVEFNHVGDLVAFIERTKGTEITMHVERNGQQVSTALVPRVNPPENQGAMGIGITYEGMENKITYYPLGRAMISGASQTAQYVGLTFYMPVAILRNIFPAEAARPTGPVGIYQQTGSAVEAAVSMNWWFPVLWLTAVLSTALAVTNLLPLPALDGGRIFFILIEAVRGKRIAPEKEGAIHFIGLALLVSLMLVISYYDVSNPIPAIDWASFF
jgi:regulator of sigma E protease